MLVQVLGLPVVLLLADTDVDVLQVSKLVEFDFPVVTTTVKPHSPQRWFIPIIAPPNSTRSQTLIHQLKIFTYTQLT